MPDTKISSADYGDKENQQDDFSVDSQSLDNAKDQKETTYINTEWAQQLGYYKKIPEFKTAVDAKARWTIGKGYIASEADMKTLSKIKGNGKDTFNSILENSCRVYNIGGDSFAEIIKDKKKLINLKPLDPGVMRIVANRQGMIIRYEQINKASKSWLKRTFNSIMKKPSFLKFAPEDIFHLSRDRVADEIHGVSLVPAVEEIILARNEAMTDYRKLLHRNVFPIRTHYLDTDDATEIAAYKAKADKAGYQGENFYVPKGTVEIKIDAVPPNATLNPLPWIQQLNQYFFQATGVPMIVVGSSQEFTEATAKIAYLAFEQTIAEEQLFVEEQILLQLGFDIELEFPATLQQDLLTGMSKEETMAATTPEDTSVTNVPATKEKPIVPKK